MKLLPSSVSAAVLAGSLLVTGVGVATPAFADTRNTPYSAAGLSSQYHVYDSGVDRSRAVGVLFYFDGDGQYHAQRPSSAVLQRMAARAAARNMILVVPVTPDTAGSRTWWENRNGNGDWFRSLAAKVVADQRIDTTRVHLAGYSGGAEFIASEVLADRAGWIRGGGATIIGGGGAYGNPISPGAPKNLPVTWYIGDRDGYGATKIGNWSALEVSQGGLSAYQRAGFTDARRVVLPGVNHVQYDLADVVGDDLDRLYSGTRPAPAPTRPAPNPAPAPPGGTDGQQVDGHRIGGAIGDRYRALGGTTWGRPVSGEHSSGHGAVYQRFVLADGTPAAIYWSTYTGAKVVDYGGAIGKKYERDGFSRTYGPPATDKVRLSDGGYEQTFSAGGKTTKIVWSPRTGARAVAVS